MNRHNQPTSHHCTCCHVCHVSMKQRPRPVAACSKCNTIICVQCLKTRWKVDQWEESGLPGWVCHKCTGTCVCKGCKGKANKTARLASKDKSHDLFRPQYEEDEKQITSRKRTRQRTSAAAASSTSAATFAARNARSVNTRRGPSPPTLPPGLGAPLKKMRRPQPLHLAANTGLTPSLFNSALPIHQKILDLQARKEKCEETIADMKGLLALMEREHKELDASLTTLVKKAATSAAKSMSRSSSACNLEQLELQSMDLAGALNAHISSQ